MKINAVTVTCLLLAATITIACAQDAGVRNQHLQALGEPAIISRDYIQEELKLSDDQKQELQKKLPDYLKVSDAQGIWAFLKETLTPEQFKRFQQLELQHEGPPAVLRTQIAKDLQITDEQRNQFIGLIQDMQKKIEPLMKEAKSGGDPDVIRPKVIRMRQDCQGKMEYLMSEAQKSRWEEMIGKPFDTLRHH